MLAMLVMFWCVLQSASPSQRRSSTRFLASDFFIIHLVTSNWPQAHHENNFKIYFQIHGEFVQILKSFHRVSNSALSDQNPLNLRSSWIGGSKLSDSRDSESYKTPYIRFSGFLLSAKSNLAGS